MQKCMRTIENRNILYYIIYYIILYIILLYTPAAQGGARKGKGFSDTALVANFSILYPPTPTLKDELVPKPRQKTA
jgi:hypothetical protein